MHLLSRLVVVVRFPAIASDGRHGWSGVACLLSYSQLATNMPKVTAKSSSRSGAAEIGRPLRSSSRPSFLDTFPESNSQQQQQPSKPPETSSSMALAHDLIQNLQNHADPKSKAWFENYNKGTLWLGCKMPVVRSSIQRVLRDYGTSSSSGSTTPLQSKTASRKRKATPTTAKNNDQVMSSISSPITDTLLLDTAIYLLQQTACDVKLAGMLLLSEEYPIEKLATMTTLERFDQDVWLDPSIIADWSTADWFALKVLQKIVFCDKDDGEQQKQELQKHVMGYASRSDASLWQRRCGIVTFLQYPKYQNTDTDDDDDVLGRQLVEACEANLLLSPQERFTQTGIAWVLRYVLAESREKDTSQLALNFIFRHGSVWTTEAKKSFCEKLSPSDPRRKRILNLS